MAKKFLEALEKYTKELGLTEAVPGSTNVMTPPVTANTAGKPNNTGQMSIDDLAKQEADHLKTTNDINTRIQSGHATAEEYAALQNATAGLAAIQAAKAKLVAPVKPGTAGATPTGSAPSTNPLVKPLV